MAPALQFYFETTINLTENNFNFGRTIYLKGRAERQAANRYTQLLDENIALQQTEIWYI